MSDFELSFSKQDLRLHDLVRMMGQPYLIKGSAMQTIQWCRRENASADRGEQDAKFAPSPR
jgi:hypothetical protein